MSHRISRTPWRIGRPGILVTAVLLLAIVAHASAAPAPPPVTRVDAVRDTLHGDVIVDPYRWLEDQDAAETRAWLDAQNTYTRSVLDGLPGHGRWRARLEALLETDDAATPYVHGERLFYVRRAAGPDEIGVLCTRRGRGPEQVLVDPAPLSPDHSVTVSYQGASVDGAVLAYGLRKGGEDQIEIGFLDVAGGGEIADRLPYGRYWEIQITPDGSACYYTRFEDDGPRVRRHRFGDDPASDRLVFGAGYGRGDLIQPLLSDDGRWLALRVLHGSAAKKVEVYLSDVANDGPAVAVVDDLDATFDVVWGGARLYMHTDLQAPNGRVVAVDPAHPDRTHWTEVIPAADEAMQRLAVGGGRLFATYLANALPEVRVFGPEGQPLGRIDEPVPGTFGPIRGAWGVDQVFYSFQSCAVPTLIRRYVPSDRTLEVWFGHTATFDRNDFEMKQVWYTSKDGTRIPMILFARRGIERDGRRPVLLTGYGGFDISSTPRYSAMALAWAEQGGIYVRTNLRGGGEFGETWHEAGMLGNKQNVFDDFIAAAEWLIHEGYTDRDHLAIMGGSNGGLLVGAVMTQRPDLFKAVVCTYPLLDMLRYDRFLVARFWVPEYGSASNPEQYRWLRAYSPYQNVHAGVRYPATLFVSGDSDTRVAPLHARKMTALLQAVNGGDPPILLSYDTRRGHTRGTSVSVAGTIAQYEVELEFLAWQLGMTSGAAPAMQSGAR